MSTPTTNITAGIRKSQKDNTFVFLCLILARACRLKWLGEQQSRGKNFTDEQCHWLEMIRDHIAANLGVEPDDFEYAPFAQGGGLGKVHQLFGNELNKIIEELNGKLAA